MSETQKLVILDVEQASRDRRLGLSIVRSSALNAIAASGAKIRHDSGGRLIVIDVAERAEAALAERLPGGRLVPLSPDMTRAVSGLDPAESLFMEALKIRTSESYREAKRRRKVGETPEEQALVSGPCVREDY